MLVPAEFLAKEWEAGAKHLTKALARDRDGMTEGEMYERLASGQWLLVKRDDAYAAVEILQYPGGAAMHICAAYAPGVSKPALDGIGEMAKQAGCKWVQCAAYGAAARLYERLGMTEAYSIMRTEL